MPVPAHESRVDRLCAQLGLRSCQVPSEFKCNLEAGSRIPEGWMPGLLRGWGEA